jgi:hypothetical protein
MNNQLPLPLPPLLSIDQGLERALMRALRRGSIKRSPHRGVAAVLQLTLTLKIATTRYRSRGTKRFCKYPFQMVLDARAMRANGYFYKEIAAALEKTHGMKVPWITVRDWTNYYHRVLP